MSNLLLSSSGEELPGYYIHAISHHLKRITGEQMNVYGITGQQARVVALIGAGLSSPKLLEQELSLRGPSVTSLLNGLEKKGFICRSLVAEDGRKRYLSLTPKGENLHQVLGKKIIENETKMISRLNLSQRKELLEMLKTLLEAVEEEG